MSFYVDIAGAHYTGFLSVNFSRSLETVCARFSIKSSALPGLPFPIQRSQPCQIYIDQYLIFTGYVETLEVNYSNGDHTITISGRDRTCDIVDSSLIGSKEFNTPITLTQVARKVLDDALMTDIAVIDNTGGIPAFNSGDIVAAEISQTLFEFLEKFCRKRQVFMTSDESGNLVFIRAGTTNTGASILNILGNKDNNVLSSSVMYKETDRFHTYIVHSQINTTGRSALAFRNRVKSFVGQNKRVLNQHISAQAGQANDDAIRDTRVKEIISQSAADIADCTQQAIWYANVYAARSSEYRCELQGFLNSSGNLWQINQLVYVQDTFCDINATMLIKDIEFDYSVDGGSRTHLTLVNKEAFTLQAMIDAQAKKANNEGGNLTFDANDTDDTAAEDLQQ